MFSNPRCISARIEVTPSGRLEQSFDAQIVRNRLEGWRRFMTGESSGHPDENPRLAGRRGRYERVDTTDVGAVSTLEMV